VSHGKRTLGNVKDAGANYGYRLHQTKNAEKRTPQLALTNPKPREPQWYQNPPNAVDTSLLPETENTEKL
jgi:hypothetical protein